YIETWYNPRRRHSTLGYLSPAQYEHQLRMAA
ncbi:MAG TPA: IS3 family transposase, partial [Gemmatimonadaceae bacterium]|nr:IS3 family transposase [Gemmatimonadaceae bacterium]